jgi:hypothetical protein
MKDGFDRKAFSAELQSLGPDERRRRTREFGRWLREASSAVGWRANLGIFFVCAAPAMFLFGFELRPEAIFLVPVAIAFLTAGSWLNLYSARRAREWRRAHPFEQWRGAR